jgi:fructose-specific phosphotransferase system component IIB
MDEQSKIVELIKTQIKGLEEQLTQAKLEFADSSLAENDWQCKNDRRLKCKVIESQIFILQKMKKEILTLFTKQFVNA